MIPKPSYQADVVVESHGNKNEQSILLVALHKSVISGNQLDPVEALPSPPYKVICFHNDDSYDQLLSILSTRFAIHLDNTNNIGTVRLDIDGYGSLLDIDDDYAWEYALSLKSRNLAGGPLKMHILVKSDEETMAAKTLPCSIDANQHADDQSMLDCSIEEGEIVIGQSAQEKIRQVGEIMLEAVLLDPDHTIQSESRSSAQDLALTANNTQLTLPAHDDAGKPRNRVCSLPKRPEWSQASGKLREHWFTTPKTTVTTFQSGHQTTGSKREQENIETKTPSSERKREREDKIDAFRKVRPFCAIEHPLLTSKWRRTMVVERLFTRESKAYAYNLCSVNPNTKPELRVRMEQVCSFSGEWAALFNPQYDMDPKDRIANHPHIDPNHAVIMFFWRLPNTRLGVSGTGDDAESHIAIVFNMLGIENGSLRYRTIRRRHDDSATPSLLEIEFCIRPGAGYHHQGFTGIVTNGRMGNTRWGQHLTFNIGQAKRPNLDASIVRTIERLTDVVVSGQFVKGWIRFSVPYTEEMQNFLEFHGEEEIFRF